MAEPAERRTEEAIRLELAAEREQLADALVDIRAGIERKRALVKSVVGVVGAAAAALTVRRVVRRFRG